MKKYIVMLIVIMLTSPGLLAFDYSFGIGLTAGYHEPVNARDSYKAVYGSGNYHLGLIGDYRMFDTIGFDMRVQSFITSGHRVTIDNAGRVTRTNNTEDLHVWSVTLGARWYFWGTDYYSPYVGMSVGNWFINTKSSIGDSTLEFSNNGFGAMFIAGVQVLPRNRFSYGFDLSYSVVPNMIGEEPGSVSHYYNESDIGGVSLNAHVQFRF